MSEPNVAAERASSPASTFPEPAAGARRWRVLVVLAAVAFIAQLDVFIVNVECPQRASARTNDVDARKDRGMLADSGKGLASLLEGVHQPGDPPAEQMEWGTVDKPAELGAYIAGVLLKKGARDLIMGIPH